MDPKIERLIELRNSKELTPYAFAKLLDINPSNYYQIEAGKRTLGKNISNAIVLKLGVNPRWWETGEGEMFSEEHHGSDAAGLYRISPDGRKWYFSEPYTDSVNETAEDYNSPLVRQLMTERNFYQQQLMQAQADKLFMQEQLRWTQSQVELLQRKVEELQRFKTAE